GCHLDGAAGQARTAARALPGLPVWAIDAGGIIVRPGPRLVTGVEALAAVLHPGAAAPAPPRPPRRAPSTRSPETGPLPFPGARSNAREALSSLRALRGMSGGPRKLRPADDPS